MRNDSFLTNHFSIFISELGISQNLATYMRMAHDSHINTDSMTPYLRETLKAEYEKVKGNQSVEQLYERIALR